MSEAYDLVAAAFKHRSDAGDLPEISALVLARSDAELAAHPGVLLELARACDAEARIRLRSRLLDRAQSLPVHDTDFAVALEAEAIADLARDTHADEVEARVRTLRPRLVSPDSSTWIREAQARSSFALGRILCWRGDPLSLAAAEDALHVSAGTSRDLRRHEWRAQALLTLGYSVHFQRGEELRGAQRLQEAIALLPSGHPRRAGVSTFLAELFVRSHLGERALPLLNEIRCEAAQTGDQRSAGYAAWLLALLFAERGDGAATLEWLADAERHPGDWFEHSTGSEFLADAAVCAECVGEPDIADIYLRRAVDRSGSDGYPEIAWFATGMINARRGDAALAVSVLAALLDEPWLPPRQAWWVWLHLALSRLRGGDEAGAARDASRGFAAANALVGPGRAAATPAEVWGTLRRLDGALLERLAPLAVVAGAEMAAAVPLPPARIRLFGGLGVEVGGAKVAVPEGKPSQLLGLVAMAHGRRGVDPLIEELWPGTPGDVGRRRLRNVVARLRATGGALITRMGDSLVLAEGTAVDVEDFVRAAEAAHRAVPDEREELARAAVQLYCGELLPEADHLPSVERLREELESRVIALLHLIVTSASQAGRIDDAVLALTRIAAIDPHDEETLRRADDLLRAAGRHRQAEKWTDRADRLPP